MRVPPIVRFWSRFRGQTQRGPPLHRAHACARSNSSASESGAPVALDRPPASPGPRGPFEGGRCGGGGPSRRSNSSGSARRAARGKLRHGRASVARLTSALAAHAGHAAPQERERCRAGRRGLAQPMPAASAQAAASRQPAQEEAARSPLRRRRGRRSPVLPPEVAAGAGGASPFPSPPRSPPHRTLHGSGTRPRCQHLPRSRRKRPRRKPAEGVPPATPTPTPTTEDLQAAPNERKRPQRRVQRVTS